MQVARHAFLYPLHLSKYASTYRAWEKCLCAIVIGIPKTILVLYIQTHDDDDDDVY